MLSRGRVVLLAGSVNGLVVDDGYRCRRTGPRPGFRRGGALDSQAWAGVSPATNDFRTGCSGPSALDAITTAGTQGRDRA
jgi:hypothetical protein